MKSSLHDRRLLNRSVVRIAGSIIAVLSLGFIAYQIFMHVHALNSINFSLSNLILLSLLALLSTVSVLVIVVVWHMFTAPSSPDVTIKRTFIIVAYSNLAKYLPGNVFHYLGRIAAARALGVPAKRLIFATAAEAGLVLAAAAAFTLLALFNDWFDLANLVGFELRLSGDLFLIVGASFAVLLLLIIRKRHSGFAQEFFRQIPILGIGFLLYSLTFCIQGVIIIELLSELFSMETESGSLFKYACIYAIAFTVGFVMPGAPGGIGVREAIFYQLVRGSLSDSTAVTLVVLLRLLSIAGDLLVFLPALGIRRVSRRDQI